MCISVGKVFNNKMKVRNKNKWSKEIDRMFQKDFSDEGKFKQKPEQNEGACPVRVWWTNIPYRGKSKSKGAERRL